MLNGIDYAKIIPFGVSIGLHFRVRPIVYRKRNSFFTMVPRALREQMWLHRVGRRFETRCAVTWCANRITAFDFQAGHDLPESKGGDTSVANLYPICARCNLSMGNRYTIQEWNRMGTPLPLWKRIVFRWFGRKASGSPSTPNPMNRNDKPPKSRGG